MDLKSLLREADTARQIDALGAGFGLSREQTEAVVGSLLPEISRRLERQVLSRGGVADLIGMLGEAQSAPAQLSGEAGRERGNEILEQVFGTRDVSRAVAARASLSSGIGESVIKAMLPYIIQMVMGAFARRASGGIGDILSKIPNFGGGAPTPQPQSQPRSGGFGLPTPGSGSPLPGPEGMSPPGRNPYGELSDVIRRGGSAGNTGGSPLWRVIRSVIGAALGFQSRGIVSWIVRYVVFRFGSSILRTVLRRVFTGR